MKLMIVEPEAGGHHMILYARLIARAAIRRGWQLQLLTTQGATRHRAYEIVRAECGQSLQTLLMSRVVFPASAPSTLRLLEFQFRMHAALRSAFRELAPQDRPDMVYVVNLDGVDKAIALIGSPFGRIPFAGLQMAVRFHQRTMGLIAPRSRNDTLQRILFRRLLRIPTLRAVVTIDEPFFGYMSQRSWACGEKVRYVPDVTALANGACTYEQARNALGISSDRIVVLAFGILDKRKGIESLVRALGNPDCPTNVIALLAGQQEPAVRDLLARPENQELCASRRIIEMPGFLDDQQEYGAFRAADIVWLGYQGFYGMSGIMVSAGSVGIPVIACREGLLGWMTEKYQLGEIIDVDDGQQALAAVTKLAHSREMRLRYGENGLTMAARHSGEGFGETICDLALHSSAGPTWD